MVNLSLLIDGNYFLYRAVFILYKLKTLYGDLETLLLHDFNVLSNMYQYNNIYFISDSKISWRKEIYSEYKSKRKKDEDIDWDFVFSTFDTFNENIKNRHNVSIYQIDPFEGDDLISYITRENNKKNISNLIISNDGDLHQLLDFNIYDKYINMIYNHKFQDDKLFLPKDYNIFFNSIEDSGNDIFDLNYDTDFLNLIDKMKVRSKIVEVDIEKAIFNKIVIGDIGDNILSVAKIKDKVRGIGKAGVIKVYNMYKELYPEDIDFDSSDFINNLTNIISIYKKNNDKYYIKNVSENIQKSIKLTILDNKYLPLGYHQILKENIKIKN